MNGFKKLLIIGAGLLIAGAAIAASVVILGILAIAVPVYLLIKGKQQGKFQKQEFNAEFTRETEEPSPTNAIDVEFKRVEEPANKKSDA